MGQGDNFKRDNLPTMLQIRCLNELECLGNHRGCVALIARKCRVNHSSVSRCLKNSCEQGYLTTSYQFTIYGRAWLAGYKMLLEDLEGYLCRIGMQEKEIPAYKKRLIETFDYHMLTAMVRNDHDMRKICTAENRGTTSKNYLRGALKPGSHPVYYMIYRMESKNGNRKSMANRAFLKPAYLTHNKRGSWLELTICEMQEHSRVNKIKMIGHLQSLKYEQGGMLFQAEVKEGKVRIPLEAFQLRKKRGGEIKGVAAITVTCNVGRLHMPESTALLIFWI